MRALRLAGVPLFHGPVSGTRCGNWAPRWFVEEVWALRLRYSRDFDFLVTLEWAYHMDGGMAVTS